MKMILKIISYLGLAFTLIPPFLVFAGVLSLETNKVLMVLGAIGWFFTAPFWMNSKAEAENNTETSQG